MTCRSSTCWRAVGRKIKKKMKPYLSLGMRNRTSTVWTLWLRGEGWGGVRGEAALDPCLALISIANQAPHEVQPTLIKIMIMCSSVFCHLFSVDFVSLISPPIYPSISLALLLPFYFTVCVFCWFNVIEFPFGFLVALITVLNVSLDISFKLIVFPYSHLFSCHLFL